jgi:pimeloyl-ACP methyl ester carboxylesterase
MQQISFWLLLFLVFSTGLLGAQEPPEWDDPRGDTWPESVERVRIRSTADESFQKAYYYQSPLPGPQPLVVSLHTWSGDYNQKDRLVQDITERGWHYIHPDFRGPNTRPEACGSPLVLSDLDDAIQFAIDQGGVDTTAIHVIGSSGGGYATLLLYRNSRHPIRTFSAWVPISNLEDWYWSSKSRGLKYADHLEAVTQSDSIAFNAEEARRRSPIYKKTERPDRSNSQLFLYAGIHDGYTGSVPITQSVHFYNKLVEEMGGTTEDQVPMEQLVYLLAQRPSIPHYTTDEEPIGGRHVHLRKRYRSVQLTIFEGRHEMVIAAALSPMINKH